MDNSYEDNSSFQSGFFDDPEAKIYFDDIQSEGKSDFFSLSVFQAALCLLLTLFIFFLAFFGSMREKIAEATEYFQSFELTKDDIRQEAASVMEFLSDAQT